MATYPKIIKYPVGDVYHLQWHYKKIEISSAEILTLNTSPVELAPAPGLGKVLKAENIVIKYDYVTAAYATNTKLLIVNGTTNEEQWGMVNVINQVISSIKGFINDNSAAPHSVQMLKENQSLDLMVETGNPTAGDGTLTVYLWYINLEL